MTKITKKVEKVAKLLCRQHKCSPHALEPGTTPYADDEEVVDGEIGGSPAFFVWRLYANDAIEIIEAIES